MKRPAKKSGEPTKYSPKRTLTEWECCACGLVHTVFIERRKKCVVITMFRNDYETDKVRK